MKRTKYTVEFKTEAVKQVTEKGYLIVDVAKRLGIGEGILKKLRSIFPLLFPNTC